MENLGVVPLLLFSAFLFLPDLTFLFSLLFLVIAVFETIKSTFIYKNHSKFTKVNKLLLKILLIVKIGSLIYPRPTLATRPLTILEKNELRTIQVADFTHFSNQNPEIIKIKKQEKDTRIIVKGQKQGISHLYFWGKGKKQQKLSFVVTTSKIKKALQLAESLNLKFYYSEGEFLLSGSIYHRKQYKKLAKIHHFAPELDLRSINIEIKLKKLILDELYQSLWRDKVYSVSCNIESLFINCEIWDPSQFVLSTIQKSVENSFIVRWNKKRDFTPKCLTLYLYEGSKLQENQLEESKEAHPISFVGAMDEKSIFNPTYSSRSYNLKLINKVTLQFIPDRNYFIKIGETKGRITTGFLKKDINEKFFDGLKIKFKIIKDSYFYIMDSKNSFISSNSNERRVFKNKTVTSTKIIPNKETYLITYRYQRKSDSSLNIFNLIKKIFFPDFTPTNAIKNKFLKATVKIKKECSNE